MNLSDTITNEDIQKLPNITYTGKITLVDNLKIFNEIKDELLLETIWGFDTESKPAFLTFEAKRQKPALLQLSSKSSTYLFRINKIKYVAHGIS